MKTKFRKFADKFNNEYWAPKEIDKHESHFHRILRILFSSIRNFIDDKCFDKASTLTFYTLLSIIPLLAIGFGIAQYLGFFDKFTEQIKTQFQSQPQVADKIIEFSNATLKTTQGGIIAAFGVILLLWTVFKMIGNIESTFDEIWKVKKSRPFWEQVKTYLPIILLFPFFLVGSSSIIAFMSTKAIAATQSFEFLNFLGPFIQFLFHLMGYLISWGLLSFIYIYLPNIKVSWKAGMIAGCITGVLYAIWQWIYVTFQINASSYGVIYGSFAAVPLFLIWLNYSWLIILFGTELSVHIQKE